MATSGYMALDPEFIKAMELLGSDPYEGAGWNRLGGATSDWVKPDPVTGVPTIPDKFDWKNFTAPDWESMLAFGLAGIPLAGITMGVAGLGGAAGAGAGGAGAGFGAEGLAGGAFDMGGMAGMENMFGIGGAGMGGGGAGGFGADMPWGANSQGGGMDLTDILENVGNFTGGDGGGLNLTDIIENAGNFTGGDGGGLNLNDIIENAGNFTGGEGGGGTNGIMDIIKKLQQIPGGSSLIPKLLAGGLGAIGSSQQAGSLMELADKQRAADKERYDDLVARERQRYEENNKRGDLLLADNVARSNARFDTLRAREDDAITRQRADIQFGRDQTQPYRDRLTQSFAPGFDPMSIPGYSGAVDTASRGLLARLAATGGNPYGNPGGMIEANKQIISGTALPAINQYQSLNMQGSGLGAFGSSGASIPGIGSGLPGSAFVGGVSQPGNPGAGSGVPTGGSNQFDTGSVNANNGMWNSIGYGLNALGGGGQQKFSLADILKSLGATDSL